MNEHKSETLLGLEPFFRRVQVSRWRLHAKVHRACKGSVAGGLPLSAATAARSSDRSVTVVCRLRCEQKHPTT